MKKFKFRALAAILLSVIMLSTSLTAAFAAGTDSVNGTNATVSWSTFPVQKRWDYDTYYTYAIQTVLWYTDTFYRSMLGSIDGKFGEGTQRAVKAFQSKEGIGDDGQVGPETWTKLQSKLVFVESTSDNPLLPASMGPIPDQPNPVKPIVGSFYSFDGYLSLRLFLYLSNGTWSVNITPNAAKPSWKSMNK